MLIRSLPRPLTPKKPQPSEELTAEMLREILHYDTDTGVFTWKVSLSSTGLANSEAGCRVSDGYLRIRVHKVLYLAHRLAWLYHFGEWPKDQIDHVNRVRSDNRISNLRNATDKQNRQNMSLAVNNTTGHTGITWHKPAGKWQARIKHNRKHFHLGLFDDLEDAVAARKAAEKLYWADTNLD